MRMTIAITSRPLWITMPMTYSFYSDYHAVYRIDYARDYQMDFTP